MQYMNTLTNNCVIKFNIFSGKTFDIIKIEYKKKKNYRYSEHVYSINVRLFINFFFKEIFYTMK